MIDIQQGSVKLLDLGIGKNLELNDQTVLTINSNSLLGTIPDMSPEHAQGEYSKQSDIFSLGATLYQFFAGEQKSPFYGQGKYATLLNIAHHQPEPLSSQV